MAASTKSTDEQVGRLMTAKEASAYTGIPLRKLQRLAADRQVPHVRIVGRGRLWFQRETLDRWIAENQIPVNESRAAAPTPTPRIAADIADLIPRTKRFA